MSLHPHAHCVTLALLILYLIGGCDAPPRDSDAGRSNRDATAASGCSLCASYAAPMLTGMLEQGELDSLSGLAVSRMQAGILFAHNDHDRPVVYALDVAGRVHARIELEGALVSDLEDIAVGPCATGSCLYLGDIGDNVMSRREYAILRFAEPRVPSAPGMNRMTTAFERYRFQFEDGSHNAEGLMVTGDGTVYVLTKLTSGSGGGAVATGQSNVYRIDAPLRADEVAIAKRVATLPIPARDDLAASAAAVHPCGLGFLVRTYNRVYEFRVPQGAGFEAAFAQPPTIVAMPDEWQSEGIDYAEGGRGFISSGEGGSAPIFETNCR